MELSQGGQLEAEDQVAEELEAEEPVELEVTEFEVGTGMSSISRTLYPHCCDKRSHPVDPNTACWWTHWNHLLHWKLYVLRL